MGKTAEHLSTMLHAVAHAVHAVACFVTVTQAPGMVCSGTAMSQSFVFCMSGGPFLSQRHVGAVVL